MAEKEPANTEQEPVLSVLKQLAEASLIVGALLYCAGWSYLTVISVHSD
jgi:hypothetical protein